ncbi:MAG: DNA recombination protein RmuC [Verrucomicrobia bacterium]|nr:DNA recombination protein RmuC [Verrucomicrobiota bacterium]
MLTPASYLLIGAAIGLALGGLIGYLWGWRRRAALPADTRLEDELRQQLARRDSDLAALRAQVADLAQAHARAEAQHAAATAALTEQRQTHEQALVELRRAQDKALADVRDAFKALSADALKQTHPEFLRLATETLGRFQESAKGDLAQRQEAIRTLVKPLEEQLTVYQQRLAQSETTQSAALGAVKKHLETLAQQSQTLSSETLQLRRVLSSNQARGRWGEETLRRVVEAAGMSAHCDFSEQLQAGDAKPDLVVRLPGDRVILVDAKVPELDFLEALEAADTVRRAEALAAHAGKLKGTIKALADRDYPRQFPNALDYVVLFLPAESLFSAALEGDRDLIVWAAHRRIMLATPASLIALLRSVSVSWQQHAQTENARAIAEAAGELYGRVATFTEHFERIRSGLERAMAAYNDAVGSYERMVRPGGEKLLRLSGGSTAKTLADVAPLDATLRLPPAASGS